MPVGPLAIPLPALLGVTDGGGSAFARGPRFALDTRADLSPVLVGDPGVRRVVCAHGSGFPLTDATSHQLWAVGFPDIVPLHKAASWTQIFIYGESRRIMQYIIVRSPRC